MLYSEESTVSWLSDSERSSDFRDEMVLNLSKRFLTSSVKWAPKVRMATRKCAICR